MSPKDIPLSFEKGLEHYKKYTYSKIKLKRYSKYILYDFKLFKSNLLIQKKVTQYELNKMQTRLFINLCKDTHAKIMSSYDNMGIEELQFLLPNIYAEHKFEKIYKLIKKILNHVLY